jgi:hypothetical protein
MNLENSKTSVLLTTYMSTATAVSVRWATSRSSFILQFCFTFLIILTIVQAHEDGTEYRSDTYSVLPCMLAFVFFFYLFLLKLNTQKRSTWGSFSLCQSTKANLICFNEPVLPSWETDNPRTHKNKLTCCEPARNAKSFISSLVYVYSS